MNITDKPKKKPRSITAMRAFLNAHFRYNTMNNWNRSTSYAVKIKVSALNLDRATSNMCYEMLSYDDAHRDSGFSDTLRDFDIAHDYRWQIGINGRSGGYAVLYQGGKRPDDHKSRCALCGQLSYAEATPEHCKCGRCGAMSRENFAEPRFVSYTSGRGIDMNGDDDLSNDEVRARFAVVWAFDTAVETAVRRFVAFAKANKVIEQEVETTHIETRHVVAPRGEK